MAYDIETLENEVIQLIKDNLENKLTEINTEKNDGIVCENIDPDAYFSTLTEQYANFNNFIYYGVIDVKGISINYATASSVKINISIVIRTDNNDADTRKKAFRYTRALKEIVDENAGFSAYTSGPEIEEFVPTDWALDEHSPNYKLAGIILTTTIA